MLKTLRQEPRGHGAEARGAQTSGSPSPTESHTTGLDPPRLDSGDIVTGANKKQLRKENKRRRRGQQEAQDPASYWNVQRGEFSVPTLKQQATKHRGGMCPSGLALEHPAAKVLLEYASGGCPARTGRPWTKEEMEAALRKR